jgi:hypothetical protein
MAHRMKNIFAIFCAALLLLAGCSSDDDLGTIGGSGELPRSDRERSGGPPKKATMPNQDNDTGTSTLPTTSSSYSDIGGHGILWKPVSESDGKLAVLLRRSYGNPTVKILDMRWKVIETGRFVYLSNPDRATYRFARSGGGYPRPCLIQVGSQTFRVPDGSRRYE